MFAEYQKIMKLNQKYEREFLWHGVHCTSISSSCDLGCVQQLTGRIGRTMLDRSAVSFHTYAVEQNVSDCRQAIHYVVYRLPATADILFYWIRMKVVQQPTCLTRAIPMVQPIRPVSCRTCPWWQNLIHHWMTT